MAIAILLSVPVPLLIAVTPRVAVNYTLHDSFVPLDAAWRTLQGQRPHFDFYTPIGDTYFWLHGAAAWLWGMDARILMWVNLLVLPLVLPLGFLLAWRRLGSLSAVLLIVLLVALIAAPTFIDGPADLIAHLADYNRIGWAFCSLVCLWALSCPRRDTHRLGVIEAIAIGGVLFFLFYLKLTYFAYAVAVIGIGCLVTRNLWWRAAVVLAVFAAGALLLEVLNPGQFGAYRSDVVRAAQANTTLWRRWPVERAINYNLATCAIATLLAVIAFWLQPGRRPAILGVMTVLGGSVLLATQNWGGFAPPSIVIIMLLAAWLPDGVAGDSVGTRPILLTLGVGATTLAALPFVFTQSVGTLEHLLLARAGGYPVDGGLSQTFVTMRWWPNELEPWRFPENFTVEEANRWALKPMPDALKVLLADGYSVLANLGFEQARVANVGFSNPFPAGLRWPDPRGVALWWDEDRTFVPAKLTADQVLGDADVVMVPKVWPDISITASLVGVIQPRLDREFTPHESRYWTAWVRITKLPRARADRASARW